MSLLSRRFQGRVPTAFRRDGPSRVLSGQLTGFNGSVPGGFLSHPLDDKIVGILSPQFAICTNFCTNLQFEPTCAFLHQFFFDFFVALRLCQFAACFVRISAILTIMCLAGGYAVHFASSCSLTLLAFVSPEIWARSSVGARLCDATTRVNRADFGGLRELKKQFDVVRCAEYPLTPSEYRVWTCQSRCDFWTFDTCCSLDNQKAL